MRVFGYHEGRPGARDPQAVADYFRAASDAAGGDATAHVRSRQGSVYGRFVASRRDVTVVIGGGPLFIGTGEDRRRIEHEAADEILDAYCSSVNGFLSALSGRFSLAVIDDARNRVVVAVDPMGIERMTYAHAGDTFVFGSSAATVARFPGHDLRLDHQSLFDYLVLHMVPAPGTIFEGVRKLRPGYCAVLERGEVRESRYWDARFTDERSADEQALQRELRESLRTAVRDSAPSARTGAFLSGGLDSSSVSGVLNEVGPSPAQTFSIGFGYPEYDELSYARIANARFGCPGHEYVVTGEDIADGFPRIARAYDEPFGNSSALPVYYCARFAREHGVDHLLAGRRRRRTVRGQFAVRRAGDVRAIPAHAGAAARRHARTAVRCWPPDAEPVARPQGPWLRREGQHSTARPARDLELPAAHRHRGGAASGLPQRRRRAGHVPQDAGTVGLGAGVEFAATHMLYYDWQYTLADNDLRKVETMSELAGVRVSYPMLHPDVVDMSMRVPADVMMPGTKLRDFYKRAMAGFLPDEIIHKKKHGFGLPFGLWLQQTPRLRDQIDGNLADLRARRIIRPDFIDRLLHLHGQEDARYYGVFIWVLAMLEQWLQRTRPHAMTVPDSQPVDMRAPTRIERRILRTAAALLAAGGRGRRCWC